MADTGDVAVSGELRVFFLTVFSGSNPNGGVDVSFLCCVLSRKGLYAGPIHGLEESYRRFMCVSGCDRMKAVQRYKKV
jgi:hypothetical protein